MRYATLEQIKTALQESFGNIKRWIDTQRFLHEPPQDGGNGQVLATDGAGMRWWRTVEDGHEGEPGPAGADGRDGFSPLVTVSETEGGHRVTITDGTGEHSFDVMDGQSGGGGTSDHRALTNRDAADQHPMSAITGLEASLEEKEPLISDLAAIRSGAAAGATAYQKPSGGIPKNDLASAVRTSLGKADSALQEHQSLAAYRTAAAQDEIDAALRFRPNLLDNWYFGNPVNQREQSVYTGTGYCIDRWKSSNSAANYTFSNGVATLGNNGNNSFLRQTLENSLKPRITYTLSVLIRGTAKGYISFNDSSGNIIGTETKFNGVYSDWHLISLTETMSDDTANTVSIRCDGGYSFQVLAFKLEIGSNQTLAHQYGGAWVLNEIPDYSEQLLKCQRYFFSLISYDDYTVPFAAGVCTTATTARFNVTTPVPMRDKPTLTNGLTLTAVRFGGTAYQISTLTAAAAKGNTIYIVATCTGLTANEVCTLVGYGTAGGRKRIDFSAEL